MNKIYTLQLSEKEAEELLRTLLGRIDLDITPKLKEAGTLGKTEKMLQLVELLKYNKAILERLEDLGVTLPL